MIPHRPGAALGGTAFATLLLIAFMMGANHVAARVAFDHGVDVVTAVCFRSGITAVVVALIIWQQRVPLAFSPRHRWALPAIGALIALQSWCLYSSVARLPVALALLAFNLHPLLTALWARLLYGHRAERRVLLAMPAILLGLALALDVFGAASGLSARAHWAQIGTGAAFAVAAAALFGLALVLTQHEAGKLDGRVRTASTMGLVGLLTAAAAVAQGGFHLPDAPVGWWGLLALTFLYGTAFTIRFTLAAARRGGQFRHHECGADLRACAGVGVAGAADCRGASGGRLACRRLRRVAGVEEAMRCRLRPHSSLLRWSTADSTRAGSRPPPAGDLLSLLVQRK